MLHIISLVFFALVGLAITFWVLGMVFQIVAGVFVLVAWPFIALYQKIKRPKAQDDVTD